jgi:hypothetical protein
VQEFRPTNLDIESARTWQTLAFMSPNLVNVHAGSLGENEGVTESFRAILIIVFPFYRFIVAISKL